MNYFVVSYDLRRFPTVEDYDRMHEALRSAYDFCWALQSFWIIGTDLRASDIIDRLLARRVLDDNDGIVVLELTGRGDYRRVATQEIADWLDGFLVKT